MNIAIIKGGCLCKAVRWAAAGKPYNLTHCHCADCRKSSGAPFVTWASFRRQAFNFIQGEPRAIQWEGRVRSFCGTCGTSLTFMSEPTEVDVTLCSFDQPELFTPRDHTWTEDRLPWIRLSDELPSYGRGREEAEKAAREKAEAESQTAAEATPDEMQEAESPAE